jgi:hypothetical protein
MYTADTEYEEIVLNLQDSLTQLRLEHEIYKKENQGSWEKNCQLKAGVILESLEKQDKDVVWIDADAVVLSSPIFFEGLDTDMSFHRTKRSDKPWLELLSGTVFFKNNGLTKTVVREWVELNSLNSELDQENLKQVVDKHPELNIAKLPPSYIKIDVNKTNTGSVISHHQASREQKWKIGWDSENPRNKTVRKN